MLLCCEIGDVLAAFSPFVFFKEGCKSLFSLAAAYEVYTVFVNEIREKGGVGAAHYRDEIMPGFEAPIDFCIDIGVRRHDAVADQIRLDARHCVIYCILVEDLQESVPAAFLCDGTQHRDPEIVYEVDRVDDEEYVLAHKAFKIIEAVAGLGKSHSVSLPGRLKYP